MSISNSISQVENYIIVYYLLYWKQKLDICIPATAHNISCLIKKKTNNFRQFIKNIFKT